MVPVPPDEAKNNVAQFETLLSEELKRASIAVIPADQTTEILKRVRQAEGGYFDPYSGLRNEAKYRTVMEHTWAELRAQLGCDAVLIPTLALVTAPWTNGIARWDGVSEPLSGGGLATGYVGAVSLWVSIHDAQDHELYFATGGIQILSKLHEGFFDTHFEHIAADTLLADQRRNLRAIHASLEAFIGPYTGTLDEVPEVQLHGYARRKAEAAKNAAAEKETANKEPPPGEPSK